MRSRVSVYSPSSDRTHPISFFPLPWHKVIGAQDKGRLFHRIAHRIANTHPALTSPAMNCPNPGGKVAVAIRKVITPGYMRRLKGKKSFLEYNLTFFSCNTITSGLWILFLWKLSATSASVALEFCYWQFNALLHWSSSFIESSTVRKVIFPTRTNVMGGMEGKRDVQYAQTWIHQGGGGGVCVYNDVLTYYQKPAPPPFVLIMTVLLLYPPCKVSCPSVFKCRVFFIHFCMHPPWH